MVLGPVVLTPRLIPLLPQNPATVYIEEVEGIFLLCEGCAHTQGSSCILSPVLQGPW